MTEKKIQLTKQEFITLINLLYTGKWNLSLKENEDIIKPLINKLSEIIDGKVT